MQKLTILYNRNLMNTFNIQIFVMQKLTILYKANLVNTFNIKIFCDAKTYNFIQP